MAEPTARDKNDVKVAAGQRVRFDAELLHLDSQGMVHARSLPGGGKCYLPGKWDGSPDPLVIAGKVSVPGEVTGLTYDKGYAVLKVAGTDHTMMVLPGDLEVQAAASAKADAKK